MRIDPEIKVLPVYQILVGVVRLLAVLMLAFGIAIASVEFLEAAFSGFDIDQMIQSFSKKWLWSQILGFVLAAALLWGFARPIALVCTPKIRLWHCQICGYDLKGKTTEPCPECGKLPETTNNTDRAQNASC